MSAPNGEPCGCGEGRALAVAPALARATEALYEAVRDIGWGEPRRRRGQDYGRLMGLVGAARREVRAAREGRRGSC
jgi:hypothetical protein